MAADVLCGSVLPRFVRRVSGAQLGFATVLVGMLAGVQAHGANVKWIDPTRAELKMTSEPKAPGAPAVILSYAENDDANGAEVTVHVRIKVLTDGGRSAGNVVIPNGVVENDEFDKPFDARTIHPDGTVLPFVSNSSNSTTVDHGNFQEKAYSLPDVQVGSIVEYQYHFANQNALLTELLGWYAPVWQVQQRYFLRSGTWLLKTPDNTDEQETRWVAKLPPGTELKRSRGKVELTVADVPATPSEQYMPPASSIFYSVRFFYYSKDPNKYWGVTGGDHDDVWSAFYKPHKELTEAVKGMVSASDSDEAKLRKIYAAVQQMENTDLTRQRAHVEDKRAGLHDANNSNDVWNRKLGTSRELTLLFIAMARALGYQAYPMDVASRGHAVFDQNVLSWSQMDSMVAIVMVNGKEMFFDPGTRMCPFAHLAPWHAAVEGVSAEGKMIKIRLTPSEPAAAVGTERNVAVKIAPDGQIQGAAKVTWVGVGGMFWRRDALRKDQREVETELEAEFQKMAPTGVQMKLKFLDGLSDGEVPLVALFELSGTMGQATKKRIVVPAHFFPASDVSTMSGTARSEPIAFPEAFATRDQFVIQLPEGVGVEALPKPAAAKLNGDGGLFRTAYNYTGKPGEPVITLRYETLQELDFAPTAYDGLSKYFAVIGNSSHEQIVLTLNGGTKPTP